MMDSDWETPEKGPDTSQDDGRLFNFFVAVTGETRGAHEEFIRQLEHIGQIKKDSLAQSDYILAFCPTPSQIKTDVGKIPRGKPVILVVMHHRWDVAARLDDISRLVTRDDVILTVDTLFWEGAFLKCRHNEKALSKVLDDPTRSRILEHKPTTRKAFTRAASSPVIGLQNTSTSKSDKKIKQDTERQLHSFFVVVTGETCGAHEQFITKLVKNCKGQIKKESVDQSDFILAFCPVASRTGTDVQEAIKTIPTGKPVILVVMHHRRDVAAYLDDSSRHVTRKEDVILTVDTLFWEGTFLDCRHNEEAFSKVLEAVGHSSNTWTLWKPSTWPCVLSNKDSQTITSPQETPSASTSEKETAEDTAITPWRVDNFRNKETLLNSVKEFHPKNENIKLVRILLHGPVGAGKSSFINSVSSILRGRMVHDAHADTGGGGYTNKYQTHTIKKGKAENFPFVFIDIMGLGRETGVHEEDIRLALKGHVMDGYTFNPAAAMSVNDPLYNPDPTPEDQTHVLVLVIPADQKTSSTLESMRKMRDIAEQMGIPLICILTKIDEASPLVKEDVKNVYKSKALKEKMVEFSSREGIPKESIFPVKNYHEEIDLNDDIDVLVLTALKHMIDAVQAKGGTVAENALRAIQK